MPGSCRVPSNIYGVKLSFLTGLQVSAFSDVPATRRRPAYVQYALVSNFETEDGSTVVQRRYSEFVA
jgi:hypothetical protein